MNRRGFLGILGAAIAGATLDPERLLWEPGKKLISIPKPRFLGPVYERGRYYDMHRGLVIRYHYDSLLGISKLDVMYGYPDQYGPLAAPSQFGVPFEYHAQVVSG